MNEKDIFDRIMCLPGLRRFYGLYEKHKSVLLYLFFGGCTTLVSIGSFMLLDSMGLNELVANVGSWLLAVAFAYVTNRIWVFTSRVQGKAIWKEMLSFYAGRLITLGIEEAMLLVFVTWLQFSGTVIKIIAQAVVLVGNYVISRFITFKKK